MSVRNCRRTIALAVGSIIFQSYENWELLVTDDGSTDGTLEALKIFAHDPRMRIFSDRKNKGLPARLNEMIARARGKFLARMDGDDISYPFRLEQQVDYLESHPDTDLVGGGILVFDGDGSIVGKRQPPLEHELICANPYAGFPLSHPTYCGKTEWFRKYGYINAAVRCEDQDLLLRSYRQSRFGNIPGIVLGYREGSLELQKILKSRRYFSNRIWLVALEANDPISGVKGVLAQYLKGAVDIFAVKTGMQRILLGHRARPVTAAEAESWRNVWQAAKSSSQRGDV
jgi:glycosyltransferase involved in cell wall biosynthesis